jgi:hypothetical protein
MSFTTAAFWKAAVERAVKTVAQSAVAVIGTSVTGILEVNAVEVLSVAGLAGLLSLLTSIGSDAVTTSDGPSLANEIAVGKHAL